MADKKQTASHGVLAPFMSPLGVWAYGVGTAIGWGSLIVTTSEYLLEGGPLGSALGLLLGLAVMLLIARSYALMMNRYPDSGGSYTYARHILGNDYGFLMAWFLMLAYLAVFWANATSLPLFSRFFLGGFFKVGYLYTLFNYEVYLGEVLLTMTAIALVGILCTRDKRIKERIMIALAIIYTGGITFCFLYAMLRHGQTSLTFAPPMMGDSGAIKQVLNVAAMTPWAFIGFESVSHSTEEFAFDRKKTWPILKTVVITTTLLYLFITLLSVSAYPAQYDSWFAYLSDLDNLSGIEGFPPFYAAYYYLGDMGVYTLMASLLALVLSSLIGNLVALSRLFVRLARDGLVPERLSELNAKGTPQRIVLIITGFSMLIPFLGRTPIGWIVDVTTISATVVYGLISFAEFTVGRKEDNRVKMLTSGIGFGVMVALFLLTTLPSLFSRGGLARETYLIVTVWAILGFLYFRHILNIDTEGTYGNTVVVWAFLLMLVFFTSTAWMQKANQNKADIAFQSVTDHLVQTYTNLDLAQEEDFIQTKLEELNRSNTNSSLIMFGMSGIALFMMVSNYQLMRERQERTTIALGAARDAAYRDPLTGVKSKNAFIEWENKVDAGILEGETNDFSVIVCDVNGLKFINDTLGHAAGDEYICNACRIVCKHFKHSPVFRIGGDEFVVVPQGEDLENMLDILAAFDREVEGNIGTNDAVISAGYSIFRPGNDRTFHDVFERADARMYQRKMQLKGMGAATRD